MKKQSTLFKVSLMTVNLMATFQSQAAFTFGDPKSETGAVSVSGYVRGNYQHKDYGYEAIDNKIQFDAAQLKLNYDAAQFFGQLEYRCYQYDTFCDFSTLVDGYVGYKISDQNTLTVGIQPIPFGPTRFWESSLYGGINNTVGLEDAHNLGANLHWEWPSSKTKIDVAYFSQDGGHYTGSSKDAARYTANLVSTDANGSMQEKHMWIGRVTQALPLNINDFYMDVGASYWYSDIENKTLNNDGHRKAWTAFSTLNYKDISLTLTGGKTQMSHTNNGQPNMSILGSYDSEYFVANNANFYTADLSYKLKPLSNGLTFSPYLMHSSYDKQLDSAKNSLRNIAGLNMDYKNWSLTAEYILSKNDPFIGGDKNSLGYGDDNEWNKLMNFTLFYRF